MIGAIKDVSTIGIANVAAQFFGVALVPFLTRLYSPDAFALYALYQSVANFFLCVSALRYEVAVVLVRQDDEALNAATVGVVAAVTVAALSFFLVPPLARILLPESLFKELENLFFLVPVQIIATAVTQLSLSWFTRANQFAAYGSYEVLSRILISLLQIAIGIYFSPSGAALILGAIIGSSTVAMILLLLVFRTGISPEALSIQRMWAMAKQYKNLPSFMSLYSLVQTVRDRATYLIVAGFGKQADVGYYALASRAMGVPTSALAGAMRPVFFQRASVLGIKGTEKNIDFALTLLGYCLVPCMVYFVFNHEWLFVSFFGARWSAAGIYGVLFSIQAMPFCLGSWLDRSYDVLGRQPLHFALELAYTVVALAGFFAVTYWLGSILWGLAAYTTVSFIYYLTYLVVIYRIGGFNITLLWWAFLKWSVAAGVTLGAGYLLSIFLTGIIYVMTFGVFTAFILAVSISVEWKRQYGQWLISAKNVHRIKNILLSRSPIS
jgi:O-antigen/teichoic acid export membrane protein